MANNGDADPMLAKSREILSPEPENELQVEDVVYMQSEEYSDIYLESKNDQALNKSSAATAPAPPPPPPEATAIPSSPELERTPVSIPPQPPISTSSIRRRRPVSGRYRSKTASWELELRIDVDRIRPMMKVSGDLYNVSGSTVSYFGSFIVDSVRVTFNSAIVIVEGSGRFTWSTSFPNIRVRVPRISSSRQNAPAILQFLSSAGSPGATYVCHFESTYFRTIQFEQDYEQTVTLFNSYNTGSLPSGGPARNLSITGAYAEAGIEMQLSPAVNVIPSTDSIGGADPRWDDAELHASMVRHFSIWRDEPQWKVWLVGAKEHVEGPGLYGIMFDQTGKQRQGCATFHRGIGGNTADQSRLQLYTYVHELGHCFNMLHSWQKHYATPPIPSRPNSLSYMNYPWYYPEGGPSGFWAAFPFQFDDQEIIHLRHAFRNNIIMGGNDFIVGSGLTALQDPSAFSEPIQDMSGLQLELRNPEQKTNFAYAEPVVVEIKLMTTDKRGKKAHGLLHPKTGSVEIAIRKPNGLIQLYKPLIQHCIIPPITVLNDEHPSIYDSAYIGYGKDGFYFDQPGLYHVRAEYHALDGSKVISNILPIRIRNPTASEDEKVADLLLGPEQGTLLFLLGSDSEYLRNGNEALDLILQEHGNHFLANYPRFVKGFNQARTFKRVTLENKIDVRKPNVERATELLKPVIDASAANRGLDNITLNMTMRHLASAQKLTGNKKKAENTVGHMVDIFQKKKLKPHVMSLIKAQAKQII
jgi:hypothetical protein